MLAWTLCDLVFKKANLQIGFRTIAPEENCPSDNFPLDDCPRIIAPRTIASEKNCPPTIVPEDNCPRGKLPPENCSLTIKFPPKNNCPHSSKFPLKSTTSELRKTMHCLRVLLSTIKQSFYQKIFFKAAN